MRRSAAPSSLAARSQKPFVSPVLPKPVLAATDAVRDPPPVTSVVVKAPGSVDHADSDTLQVEDTPKAAGPLAKKSFRAPLHAVQPSSVTVNNESTDEEFRVYAVMWCKMSSKKHKTYDDGILVVKGPAMVLKDTEGKDIGKTTLFGDVKKKAIMTPGQQLTMMGKEIEISQEHPVEMYTSGKLFLSSASLPAPSSEPVLSATAAPKGKSSLGKRIASEAVEEDGSTGAVKSSTTSTNSVIAKKRAMGQATELRDLAPQPLFAVTADSFVLQQPDATCKVPIVVDPRLATLLRPHQRQGVQFLYDCVTGRKVQGGQGCILADEMGLGKTLQALSLLWTLLKQGPDGKPIIKKAVVVCPSSLVNNWKQEVRKWLGSERVDPIVIGAGDRKLDGDKVTEFIASRWRTLLIVSYDMFRNFSDQLQNCNEIGLLICDEGHRLKNSTIKTRQAIDGLKTKRRVILTGTPVQNDLAEFFSLIDFCNPAILGTEKSFRQVFESVIVRGREPTATPAEKELGDARASELARITGSFVLRRTSSILNAFLPPRSDLVLFCRMSPLQQQMYSAILRSKTAMHALSGDQSDVLSSIMTLRHVCAYPGLLLSKIQDPGDELHSLAAVLPAGFNDKSPVDTTLSGKLLVLEQLLSNIQSTTQERVVIVSNFTRALDVIQQLFEAKKWTFARLDGSTEGNKRMDLVSNFNTGYNPPFAFLLSSKAGGTGLNLIGASRLILVDPDWNPATDLQALGRIWRDGQKRPCYTYRLLTAGTIEEKIYQRQQMKTSLSDQVVDEKSDTKQHFSREDLRDLFTLSTSTTCDTHDLLGCECCSEAPSSTSDVSSPSRRKAAPKSKTAKMLTHSGLHALSHFASPADCSDSMLHSVPASQLPFVFEGAPPLPGDRSTVTPSPTPSVSDDTDVSEKREVVRRKSHKRRISDDEEEEEEAQPSCGEVDSDDVNLLEL